MGGVKPCLCLLLQIGYVITWCLTSIEKGNRAEVNVTLVARHGEVTWEQVSS